MKPYGIEKYYTYFVLNYEGKKYTFLDKNVNGKASEESVKRFYEREFKSEENNSILNFPNFIGCYYSGKELIDEDKLSEIGDVKIEFEVMIQ